MNRICPNCNNRLADHEMYFCQNCGQKLDDELIADNAVFHIKKSRLETPKKTFSWKLKFKKIHLDKRMVFAFIFLLIIGAVSVGAIYFLNLRMKKEEAEQLAMPPPPPEELKVEYAYSYDLSLEQPNMAFSKEELTDYVPFDVDFYLAGSNVTSSLKLLWGEEARNDLLSILSDYVKESFVIFGQQIDSENTANEEDAAEELVWETALILYLSQEELPEEVASAILTRTELTEDAAEENSPEGDEFFVRRIGNAIVVTQYEPFFEQVDESYKGTAKNVTHKPKYSSYKQELAPDGQLLFMDFTDDPASVYSLFETYGPSDELEAMLGEVLTEKYGKFVIRRK